MRNSIILPAKKKVKGVVIEVIESAMTDVPGIRWLIGNNPKKIKRKIRSLAKYVFETSWRKGGVYLSKDKKGVAILLRQNSQSRNKLDIISSLKFICNCTGLRRALEIVRRESYIQDQHPSKDDYLYFWIYAVHPEARGFRASVELKERVFKESERTGLPIYLETTVAKNKRVYERYGFKVYHEWYIAKQQMTMWFMKRELRTT